MPKRKPIRTLAEAERWCRRNRVTLEWRPLCPEVGEGRPRYVWVAYPWIGPADQEIDGRGPTPWAAVEKLRRKVEGR